VATAGAAAAAGGGVTDQVRIAAAFAEEEACVRGITAVQAAGTTRPRVFSPFASEHIAKALNVPRSPVRFWVLLGGITGCCSGFALTIGLVTQYPRVTAGMPIVSIPPFVIIAFELTILFGALVGVLGFLVHGRFPALGPMAGYSPRFSNDRFGLVCECTTSQQAGVEALLRAAGASEVTYEPL
jgi:hypothetical protein